MSGFEKRWGTRRHFAAAVAAIIASPEALAQRSPKVAPSPAAPMDIDDILSLQFEADDQWMNPGATVAPVNVELAGRKRKEVISEVRGLIDRADPSYIPFRWAPDLQSPDYHHLASMQKVATPRGDISTSFSSSPFQLSAATLQRIAAANYFEPALPPARTYSKNTGMTLFALRGCISGDVGPGWKDTVTLTEVMPDHRARKCIIGIWNGATRKIQVFEGSTVPAELHMAVYQTWLGYAPAERQRLGDWETNMFPQGLHLKEVGTMWKGKPIGAQLPLSFKQFNTTPILRAMKGEQYDLASDWDPARLQDLRLVGDNLHAGIVNHPAIRFSSQGCQTIRGRYVDGVGQEHVGLVHTALGLSPAAKRVEGESRTGSPIVNYFSASDGARYPFLMITGREARLHALGADPAAMRRIRIGSEAAAAAPPGHPVKRLKAAIGADGSNAFDGVAMFHLLRRQKSYQSKADAIIAPHTAPAIGFQFDLPSGKI